MNDVKNLTHTSSLVKNTIIIVLSLVIVFIGFFIYRKIITVNTKTPEEMKQDVANIAAKDAAAAPVLDTTQRKALLQEIQTKNTGIALPPKEAQNREAEIMNNLLK